MENLIIGSLNESPFVNEGIHLLSLYDEKFSFTFEVARDIIFHVETNRITEMKTSYEQKTSKYKAVPFFQ